VAKNKKLSIQSGEAWDSTFQLMSWWDADSVKNGVVLVVGAGALGNEVLKNLTLMNVGKIIIVDFDTIEMSNLNRSILFRADDANKHKSKAQIAADRMMEINPNIKVIAINADITYQLGLGLIRRCDVIIGCLDNRIARLYLNRFCSKVNKPWIDGAIENLAGTMTVNQLNKNCYECNLSETEWKNIRFRLGCPDVASSNTKQIEYHRKFYYEGMNNIAMWVEGGDRNEECESHMLLDPILENNKLSNDMTLKDFFKEVSDQVRQSFKLLLDTELVLELTSKSTEKSYDVVITKAGLNDEFLNKFRTQISEDFMITKSVASIENDSNLDNYTLHQIGIPPLAIVDIETKDDILHIELSKDLSKYTLLNN
jgi:molybdopterin/thiamine biosynthesis adenylyltransferase